MYGSCLGSDSIYLFMYDIGMPGRNWGPRLLGATLRYLDRNCVAYELSIN